MGLKVAREQFWSILTRRGPRLSVKNEEVPYLFKGGFESLFPPSPKWVKKKKKSSWRGSLREKMIIHPGIKLW